MKVCRPAILFLSSLIVGILIAYSSIPDLFKLCVVAIAIFLYFRLFLDGKLYIRTLIVILIFGAVGFLRFRYVEMKLDNYALNVESLGKGSKVITGLVESIGKSTNSNYYILSNCESNGLPLGRCRCYFGNDLQTDVKIGNLVMVTAGTSIIEEPLNEGEFNQKNYYRSDNITFISFANNIEITNDKYDKLKQKIYELKLIVKSQIFKILNEKDAGLFSAMVTGDKSTIDKTQRKKFSDNGIAHILAISGLHLSILGLALFELLRKRLSVNVSAGFVSIFILLYGIFIDAGPASLRAIIMLFVRFLSLAIGRTYDSKNTLYIVALAFLLYKPYLLFNAGFQFSYVAIFALNHKVSINFENGEALVNISATNGINDYGKNKVKNAHTRKKQKDIPAVIVLTLFLFPITIYHYFTYPLYSIFLNLIVIPLMSFVLGFGLFGLLTSFIYLPIGQLLAMVVHVIFMVYDKLCEVIELLPAHILALGKPSLYETLYYYLALFLIIYVVDNIVLYKVLNKKRKKLTLITSINLTNVFKILLCSLLLFISIIIMSIRPKSDMRMTFVSIGQGDGILIESKNMILTIDGGSSSNTNNGQYVLSPHIKSRAINHIDYSFITHADSDHTNGIIYLLQNEDEVTINNIVFPITAINDEKFNKLKEAAAESGVNILYMKEEDELKLKDNFVITVLSPNEGSLQSKKIDENEMSLTFRIDYNDHSALFTGDIGKQTMGRMLKDDFSIQNMDVEVFKVPHHGSKNSNVPEFFELASPKYSVISYGKNNNYGHPNIDTVDAIADTGSKILKTAESGQIDIYFDKENITYKTYREIKNN